MKLRISLHWQRTAVVVLVAFALASVLLASGAHAQSTQPTGNGDAHGMTGAHAMMGGHMMMGHQRMAGQMMGHHMMGGAMGMHGMMGRRGGTAAASESSTADAAQAGTEAKDAVQDEAQAGPPVGFLAALQSGDPQRGRQLAAANACMGCHSLSPGVRTVGPTWYDLAETAATRVPGQRAEAYLYTSIVHPNAYVVQGYQPNIMVQTYGQTLAEDEIADLVRYLLTLHEQE